MNGWLSRGSRFYALNHLAAAWLRCIGDLEILKGFNKNNSARIPEFVKRGISETILKGLNKNRL